MLRRSIGESHTLVTGLPGEVRRGWPLLLRGSSTNMRYMVFSLHDRKFLKPYDKIGENENKLEKIEYVC